MKRGFAIWLAQFLMATQATLVAAQDEFDDEYYEEEPPPQDDGVRVDASEGEEGGMPATQRAREMVERARRAMDHEPTPRECVREAMRYFHVNPDVLARLRARARSRAVLPTVTGGYRLGDVESTQIEQVRITNPTDTDLNFGRRDNALTVSASWDLREAIFNGDQVQVYSLVGVQRDIILEVLRAYFARRQLALTVALVPPEDPIALASLMLRIEEFTAVLDTLTGGWFGDQLEARSQRRR